MAVPLGLDTPLKQSIFAAYVFLWVASALLVYASKQSGAPPYNATSVVVLTELAKLGLALAPHAPRAPSTRISIWRRAG
mgnify:CR=1 FL=1